VRGREYDALGEAHAVLSKKGVPVTRFGAFLGVYLMTHMSFP
jgi:hypothetical protein